MLESTAQISVFDAFLYASIITVLCVILMLLVMALICILDEIHDKIKVLIYGEPITPYKLFSMPSHWRYNARRFDSRRLLR